MSRKETWIHHFTMNLNRSRHKQPKGPVALYFLSFSFANTLFPQWMLPSPSNKMHFHEKISKQKIYLAPTHFSIVHPLECTVLILLLFVYFVMWHFFSAFYVCTLFFCTINVMRLHKCVSKNFPQKKNRTFVFLLLEKQNICLPTTKYIHI